MTDIAALKAANERRWKSMHVRPELASSVDAVAGRLVATFAKQKYQDVSAVTGVPWFVVAVIHERESSQSWLASLAQGDPWNSVSVHVPRGRGPFRSWEDAAEDALKHCAPYAARWSDWSIGGALTLLEEYNGLGYAARDVPSPYIWAATDQYKTGKYVADGHYDPAAIDHQIGCAALLARMMLSDKSIVFSAPKPIIAPAAPHVAVAPTAAEAAAAFASVRALVNARAGWYASMISDAMLKEVVADALDAAAKVRAAA